LLSLQAVYAALWLPWQQVSNSAHPLLLHEHRRCDMLQRKLLLLRVLADQVLRQDSSQLLGPLALP
jgi:hypothetical protein